MITTVISHLFANMASQMRPNVILGEDEIVAEIYADALSDISDG
jgi:hypothetical protein